MPDSGLLKQKTVAGEEDASSLLGHGGLHHDVLEITSALEEELDVGRLEGLKRSLKLISSKTTS